MENLVHSSAVLDLESDDADRESEVQISSCYTIHGGSLSTPPSTLIEHCCLMTRGNEWVIEVKCRPVQHDIREGSQQKRNWRSLMEVYPNSIVKQKHNDTEVILPPLREDLEIAAFGRPGKDDRKRMQMAIFASRPTQGRDWKIWVYLVDDTNPACKSICHEEDKRGNSLLSPCSGMFVSNSKEDITIELSALEPGWKIKGSSIKTIKSRDAWNSPENSVDFPRCYFEIRHVDRTKQSFFCRIKASHEGDVARAEIVGYFEKEKGRQVIQTHRGFKKLSNPDCDFSAKINTSIPTFLFVLFVFFASSLSRPRLSRNNSNAATT